MEPYRSPSPTFRLVEENLPAFADGCGRVGVLASPIISKTFLFGENRFIAGAGPKPGRFHKGASRYGTAAVVSKPDTFGMMNRETENRAPGKIEDGAAGLGVPSPEQQEIRAIDLAELAGRASSEVTDADREQARRELLGEAMGALFPPEGPIMAYSVSWSEPPGSTGSKTPVRGPEDEAAMDEQLVEEGVEEALHDEMLEARKKNIDAAS
jgi:hypothetical protein